MYDLRFLLPSRSDSPTETDGYQFLRENPPHPDHQRTPEGDLSPARALRFTYATFDGHGT
jgi:hypothetical protein